jgi:hypothetical protein
MFPNRSQLKMMKMTLFISWNTCDLMQQLMLFVQKIPLIISISRSFYLGYKFFWFHIILCFIREWRFGHTQDVDRIIKVALDET